MVGFILDIIFLCWIGEKYGYGITVGILIAEVILFLILSHSLSMDEWRAHLNRTKYWKDQGPY